MSEYGLDPKQLLLHVIRPALISIGAHSRAAEVLVLGTGMVESDLRYVDQIDKAGKPGPAFGLWQMEGFTHADLYTSYLPNHPDLRNKVLRMTGYFSGTFPDPGELVGNLRYAAAMCRIRYLPAKPALPGADDTPGLADYYVRFYNRGGKSTVAKSIPHFDSAVKIT